MPQEGQPSISALSSGVSIGTWLKPVNGSIGVLLGKTSKSINGLKTIYSLSIDASRASPQIEVLADTSAGESNTTVSTSIIT